MRSSLPELMDCIFDQVEINHKEMGCFSKDDLTLLYTIFGSLAERAFELLDKKEQSIKQYRLIGSSKSFYKVEGSTVGTGYYLWPSVNYCQCPAHLSSVVKRGSRLTCKHVLACRLAQIMNRTVLTIDLNFNEYMEVEQCAINNYL